MFEHCTPPRDSIDQWMFNALHETKTDHSNYYILLRLLTFSMGDVKYKKRLLLTCIRYFKSDLINNMVLMPISGNNPSSVILIKIM